MHAVRFCADDASVIDRWIDSVCGESMEVPAHRRSQFLAFREHIRPPRRGSGGSSVFHSSARSGTREIAALQNILAGLRSLHEASSAELSSLCVEADSVRHVLAERSAAAPEPLPSANGHDSHGPAESRRKVAGQYVAGLERQRAAGLDELAACRRRYLLLMDQKEQLRKEVLALEETQHTVVERYDATVAALAAERAALAEDIAAWEQCAAGEDSNSEAEDGAAANSGADSLSAMRRSLAAASDKLSEARTALGDVDSAHAVRFRQSRQRLKDWQDIVGHQRRLRDQLAAQTRVMGAVVAATAGRLEAERSLGYKSRLQRLNQAVLAHSAKKLGLWSAEPAEATEQETPARPHAPVPPPSPSPRTADGNDGSSVTSSIEERVQREAGLPPQRRRRAYALITHLERWEGAILGDTAAMRRIAEKGVGAGELWARVSKGDGQPSPEMTQAFQELRHMLLSE